MDEKTPIATPPVQDASHEALFGTLLLAAMILFTILSLGGIGFMMYSKWQAAVKESKKPSIAALVAEAEKEISRPVADDISEKEQKDIPLVQESATVNKSLEISVLNGGAVKGSASVAGEILKSAGYTKVTTGNTVGNYTGTVVYFASGSDKEAAAIKESLGKKYPNSIAQAALATNKETSVSPITVILGK